MQLKYKLLSRDWYKLKFLFLCTLSWFLVAFGQPSWFPCLGPLAAILGFALFWKALVTLLSAKQRFWCATAWFTAVSLIQLSWMTAYEFQGIYILFAYVLIAFFLGLQFGGLSLLIKEKMSIREVGCVAGVWTLIEWGRLFLLCGYSFNPVGVALSCYTLSMQLAAIVGVYGLTFCCMGTNLLFLTHRYRMWLGAALLPYAFGFFHLTYHNGQQGEKKEKLAIALVQTGLLPSEKMLLKGRHSSFISPSEQWRLILKELKRKKDAWDLIALPEAAVPFFRQQAVYSLYRVVEIFVKEFGSDVLYALPQAFSDRVSNDYWAQTLSNIFQAEVVIGLDEWDAKIGEAYSSAFHYLPNQTLPQRYEKRVLVPLAEYLPFSWLKPLVKRYGISEFFTPGKEAKVFRGKIPLSISICYEETFPDLIREGRKKGAELLVNVTNDNWYPFSRLPEQHFTLGRLRAIENGVPVIRASNSGVTAAVDSSGRVLAYLKESVGVLSAHVSLYHYKTLFTYWGNAGIVGLSLIFIVLGCLKSFYQGIFSKNYQ